MDFEGKTVDESTTIDAPCASVWRAIQELRTLESGRRKLISYENGEAIIEEAFLALPIVGEAKCTYKECETPTSEIKYSLVSSDKFKIFEGTWTLTPVDEGKTRIRLTANVDAGLRVPFWKEIAYAAAATHVSNRFRELASRASKLASDKAL